MGVRYHHFGGRQMNWNKIRTQYHNFMVWQKFDGFFPQKRDLFLSYTIKNDLQQHNNLSLLNFSTLYSSDSALAQASAHLPLTQRSRQSTALLFRQDVRLTGVGCLQTTGIAAVPTQTGDRGKCYVDT
jgi:hypothetical protein